MNEVDEQDRKAIINLADRLLVQYEHKLNAQSRAVDEALQDLYFKKLTGNGWPKNKAQLKVNERYFPQSQ